MKAVIDWLMKTELRAAEFYSRSASLFPEEDSRRFFLLQLAQDELWHSRILREAAASATSPIPDEYRIGLSESITAGIDKIFETAIQELDDGGMTPERVFKTVDEAEFSEWNAIFVYVVNTLLYAMSTYRSIAPRIQSHLRQINHFLENLEGSKNSQKVKTVPAVWEENILIVDDYEPITEIFSAVLAPFGRVQTAADGVEGLEKAAAHYFAVIVSDLDMPKMNGIEFFNELTKRFGDIRRRFLFISGNPDKNALDFFKRNHIRFLPKPVDLEQIRQVVHELLTAY